VFAYRLIAEGTVEDKVLELQRRKQDLAAGIFANAGGGVARLSADDLALLLAP
jgi:SNF2 family DNA or RNA helicase